MKTSESHPIIVNFIDSIEFPILNQLGMTFAPGKKQRGALTGDWNRDLSMDLRRLREYYKTDILVSLVEDFELTELQITGLSDVCKASGIELIRFEIRDGSVPASNELFSGLVSRIVRELEIGKKVVVHCKGGLGRAGTVTACMVLAAAGGGLSPDRAIDLVRATRPKTIENFDQERFVKSFGAIRLMEKE